MLDFDVTLFPCGVRVTVNAALVLDAAEKAREQAGVVADWAHVKRLTPFFNGKMAYDKYEITDRPTRVSFTDGARAAVHFVGFRGEEYWSAVKVFGLPDFYHHDWDSRAKREIADGDVVVFARKADPDYVTPYTYDDSNQRNDPAYWERMER